MRCTPRVVVVLAACSLGCISSGARSPSTQVMSSVAPEDADQVLAQYYEAIGGFDRLKSITTRYMHGRYDEGTIHGTTEIFHERPQLRRVNLFTPQWDHLEGFDGQTWEYHRDAGQSNGHLVRDSIGGAAELAQRRGSEFDESFVAYRARGFQAKLMGREPLGELEAYRVRVTRTDDWTVEYYFEVHSHLLLAVRKAMPLHAQGPDVRSLTFYSDWRFVRGVLVPFAGEERNTDTGALMSTLKWDLIQFNVPIKRGDILPPPA